MQNSLDKLIGYFAPGLAVKRAADRVRLRAYEGASKGRRAQHWNAGRSSADTELAIAGVELRARSRDLERNNKHVAKAASVHADNIVGEGIIPRANTDDKDLNKKIDDLFDDWVENCSPDGQQTFYSLQHQAARGMVVGGEMLARKRIRRSSDGLKIPLQIQPIEPDLLDDAKVAENAARNVVNGIEFDQIGRRTGYWMFQVHPGTQKFWGKNNLQSRKVPADQIVHLYEAQRVQARGAPWTAPILLDVKDLQEYQTAEVWRKKIEACVVGAVIPNSDDLAPTGDDNVLGVTMKDARGNNVTRMEPGMFVIAEGGKEVNFNNPAVTLSQESYHRLATRDIAAGLRVPHVLMTGDTSQMNFSTFRADMVAYKRFIRAQQQHYMLPMYCKPIYGWFLEMIQLLGLIEPRHIPVMWTLPRFEQVNPIDDIRADLMAVRAGFKTLKQVQTEYGNNHDQWIAQVVEINEALDDKDIVLDTDPRHTTLQGQMQLSETNDGGTGADQE